METSRSTSGVAICAGKVVLLALSLGCWVANSPKPIFSERARGPDVGNAGKTRGNAFRFWSLMH